MKTVVILFLGLSISFGAFAQRSNTWKGGKPGRETEWNCAANWSSYRVPDEFSDVFIPKMEATSYYPVIPAGNFEINTLRISRGATITITSQGYLMIRQPDFCDDVSRIVSMGKLDFPGRQPATYTALVSGHHLP